MPRAVRGRNWTSEFRRDQPPETDLLPTAWAAGCQRQSCRASRSALVRHSQPRVRPIVIAARSASGLPVRNDVRATGLGKEPPPACRGPTSGSRPRRGQEPGPLREQLWTSADAPRLGPAPTTAVSFRATLGSSQSTSTPIRETCRPRCAAAARLGQGPVGCLGCDQHRGRSAGLERLSRLRSEPWPSVFSRGGSRWLPGCGFLRPVRRIRVRRRRR